MKFCVKVCVGGIAKNADGKNQTKPVMADAEPKTPAVQEGKKCSKREGRGLQSIGHEEGMEWRTKTFRTRGVVSQRNLKKMIFHGKSLPQGPKLKKEMFCSDDRPGSKAEERRDVLH